jgi:hypothetical protein
MSPDNRGINCLSSNFFSNTLTPALQERLPQAGTLASRVIDHTTKIPTFLDTVSKDLCDDGRMSGPSRDAGLSFIARSATAGAVTAGTVVLGLAAVATAGAPLTVAALGVAGLVLLPPAADWAVGKVSGFIGGLFGSSREQE